MIDKILKSKHGKIIISIIWGLGLAALFRKVCEGRSCLVIKGPKPKEVDGKIYKFDNKCYKYNSYTTKCSA
jgi:hypothetical protein